MSIQCQICGEEFESTISHTHLKKHKITTTEYKERYGAKSLSSPEHRARISAARSGKNNPNYGKKHTAETRKKISDKVSGKAAWNKGLKLEDTTTQKQAAIKREERYRKGELQRKTHDYSAETREKISKSVKEYARKNPEIMKERAKRGLETKISRGRDLAFFRGHKHTDQAKEKMAAARTLTNQRKSQRSMERTYANAEKANVTITDIHENRVSLICDVCNEPFVFTRQYLTATGKFRTELCPSCFPRNTNTSMLEQEIFQYIQSLGVTVYTNNRSLLGSKQELDLWIPERSLAIEVNGLYWHSDRLLTANGYDPKKDFHKHTACKQLGIDLITIFEDEWYLNSDIVKSRLSGFFNRNIRIGARKCSVQQISSKQANAFLRDNHLQGSGRSNVRYGLFHNNELVSVMTFSRENISRKITGWELNRFCHKLNHNIVGGASRLFNRFVLEYSPEQVISYSDNRWGNGDVYGHLGMEMVNTTVPNYWYFKANDLRRHHRYALRKNSSDDPNLTEWENRQLQGWNRIWDCGNTKWVYKKNPA